MLFLVSWQWREGHLHSPSKHRIEWVTSFSAKQPCPFIVGLFLSLPNLVPRSVLLTYFGKLNFYWFNWIIFLAIRPWVMSLLFAIIVCLFLFIYDKEVRAVKQEYSSTFATLQCHWEIKMRKPSPIQWMFAEVFCSAQLHACFWGCIKE